MANVRRVLQSLLDQEQRFWANSRNVESLSDTVVSVIESRERNLDERHTKLLRSIEKLGEAMEFDGTSVVEDALLDPPPMAELRRELTAFGAQLARKMDALDAARRAMLDELQTNYRANLTKFQPSGAKVAEQEVKRLGRLVARVVSDYRGLAERLKSARG